MKYLVFFIVIAIGGCAQPIEKPLIEISIVQDSIQTFADNLKIIIPFCFKNVGNENLLVYGTENFRKSAVVIANLCDNERVGAGLAVLVYDQGFERMYARWEVHDSTVTEP